jgi:hypothetical protein
MQLCLSLRKPNTVCWLPESDEAFRMVSLVHGVEVVWSDLLCRFQSLENETEGNNDYNSETFRTKASGRSGFSEQKMRKIIHWQAESGQAGGWCNGKIELIHCHLRPKWMVEKESLNRSELLADVRACSKRKVSCFCLSGIMAWTAPNIDLQGHFFTCWNSESKWSFTLLRMVLHGTIVDFRTNVYLVFEPGL